MCFPLIAALLILQLPVLAVIPCESCFAPTLPSGSEIKVMTYNIQLALGEYRRFWQPDEKDMPSKEQVRETLAGILRVIKEEQPDILFLQEASRHSVISHYFDQITAIKAVLEEGYCIRSEYYWNKRYVPDGKMWGPMDYSLVIFSRYLVGQTRVTELPSNSSLPRSWFSPHRILIETDLLMDNRQKLTLLNTHLDAHDRDGSLRLSQAKVVHDRIRELREKQTPFILAGDFNLIPPGSRKYLPANQQERFSELMNMGVFYDEPLTAVIPSLQNATGTLRKLWTTAYDENLHQLDLTIDYLIYSTDSLKLKKTSVLQEHFLLSDHVPITATFQIKTAGN